MPRPAIAVPGSTMSSSEVTESKPGVPAQPMAARGAAGGGKPRGAVANRTGLPVGTGHGGRLLSLDILRAVAILLVLGRHAVAPAFGLGWFERIAAGWNHVGWSGVDLFFVLSGFLVSGLIFAEYRRNRHVNIARFVIRRGFKIWPAYFFYLGFVACWLAWKHHLGESGPVWAQIWPNVFHVQNYFHTPRIQTWSLAVEEHFYLAVALGFYWLLSRGHADRMLRHFPRFVAVLIAGLVVLRSVVYLREGPDRINLFATHLRFDGLLFGTLLAYYTHFEPEKLERLVRHPVALMGVGLLLAAPTVWLLPEHDVWTAGPGLTVMYVGYGFVMLGFMNLPQRTRWGARLFALRPAAWLGAIGFYSYSIYLWHLDLGFTPLHKLALWAAAAGWAPGVVWLVTMPLYVAVAVAGGVVMSRLLEMPSLALRDRLFPSFVKPVPMVVPPAAPGRRAPAGIVEVGAGPVERG